MNTKELLNRCSDLNIEAYVYDGGTPPSGCDVIIVEKTHANLTLNLCHSNNRGGK